MKSVFEMKQIQMVKGWRRPLILMLFSCFYSLAGLGQNPVYKHFNTENGLVGNGGIFDIFQDSRNFIWIATENGICKFDGQHFETYDQNVGTGIILKFNEDPQHRMWALSFAGELTIFDGDSIYDYAFNSVVRDYMMRGKCSSFRVDLDGTLHVGVQNGYFIVTPNGDLIWRLTDHKGFNGVCIQLFKNAHPFHFLLKDSSRNGTHIYSLNHNLQIESKVTTPLNTAYAGQSTVEASWNGKQQLVKVNGTILLFDDKKLIAKKHFNFPFTHSHLDSRGQVWVSRPHNIFGETFCYTMGEKELRMKGSGFNGQSVISFLTDHEGGLWLGTHTNGLFYVPEPLVWQYHLKNDLWKQDYFRSTISFDDSLVLGSQYGLQGAVVNGQLHVHNLDLGTKGSFGKSIVEIVKHSTNSALALFDYEIYWYNWQQPERYPSPGNKKIISISNSSQNGVSWVLRGDSIGFIKDEGLQFLYKTPSVQARKIFEVSNGELYLTAYDGLWKLEHNKFENLGQGHHQLSDATSEVLFDDEVLWVVTSNGFFGLKNDSIFSIANENDFGKNAIRGITKLKDTIWASTKLGLRYLKQLSLDEYELATPGFLNGVSNVSFSFIDTHKNQLVLSRGQKIIMLNPNVLRFDTVRPTLFLKSLKINDSDTLLHSGYSLHHTQSSIEFELGTINLRNADNQQFEFQMVGFDQKVRTTLSSPIRYDYIPPGTYEFQLTAVNQNSRARSKRIKIHIEINPPFWKTSWFIVLIFVLAFSTAWILVRMRFRSLLRRRDTEKRLIELESSALRAQMNPHFIFNVLGSIQSYILENNISKANDYLGQFARLIRQMLTNSRNALVSLESEIQALDYYMKLERMRLGNVFNYSLIVDPTIEIENFYIPPLLIQPYVENAIIHGISSIEKGAEINVEFTLTSNQLICAISDNGVGITPKIENGMDKNAESVGMLVSKERIQMLNTEHGGLANVLVEDQDESNLNRGTRVTIAIPIFNTPEA